MNEFSIIEKTAYDHLGDSLFETLKTVVISELRLRVLCGIGLASYVCEWFNR